MTLVSEVDSIRMRVDAVLIGGGSEDLRTPWKDVNSLSEVFRGYQSMVTDIDTKFNLGMARHSTLKATIVSADDVQDNTPEVSQHARHCAGTKRHSKKSGNHNYDSDSSALSAYSGRCSSDSSSDGGRHSPRSRKS